MCSAAVVRGEGEYSAAVVRGEGGYSAAVVRGEGGYIAGEEGGDDKPTVDGPVSECRTVCSRHIGDWPLYL